MSYYGEVGLDPDIKKFICFICMILVAAGTFIFHLRFPGLSLLGMWIVLGIGAAIGWVIGRVMSHHVDGDGRAATIMTCALVVAWLIPVVGAMLSSAVWELANVASRRRYLLACASTVCCLASALNGAAGAVYAQQARMDATRAQLATQN